MHLFVINFRRTGRGCVEKLFLVAAACDCIINSAFLFVDFVSSNGLGEPQSIDKFSTAILQQFGLCSCSVAYFYSNDNNSKG